MQQQLREAERLQNVQQQRIQSLNRELAQLDAITQARLFELRSLEGEITRLERERAELSRQIKLLQGQVSETEAKIKALETELAGLKERLAVLVNSLHREQASRYLPLLRAESFTDLAVRVRWTDALGSRQTDLIDRIQATVASLQDERTRLTLLVKDLNEKQAEREKRIQVLSARRQTLQGVLADLQQQQMGRRVLLRETLVSQQQLRQEFSRISAAIMAEQRRLAEIRRQQEEERRRQEEARRRQQAQQRAQQQTQQNPSTNPGPVVDLSSIPRELVGSLLFPVPSGRISAAYGQDGNDFQEISGPSAGSPVRAAADGVVIPPIIYVANIGYTVTIQHSQNLITLYTNLQSLQVEEGQRVGRGQLLGYTGGGALIAPEQVWFRVGVINGGSIRYVDPSVFY
ncbi:MAG TPA: peptidoglycan DD-metalloendopeptidase family protein [Meiothermus sp.]|nr:peptidoglycan DD-metalloendopeptidase family protein [Meiothermus sp.]